MRSRDQKGGGDKGFDTQSNDRVAHPIGSSPITPEPGGFARVRKTCSPIGKTFILDHILRLVSEGHATSQDEILDFSKNTKEGGGGNCC